MALDTLKIVFFGNYASTVDNGPSNLGSGVGSVWNGMWREPNCSLIHGTVSGSLALVAMTANWQDQLHQAQGVTSTPDVFAGGCAPPTTGIASEFGAFIHLANGNVAIGQLSSDGVSVTVGTVTASPTVISQADYPTNGNGASPVAVASASLRGNAVSDMVVAGVLQTNGALSVLLGNGDGTFATGQVLDVAITPPPGGPAIGESIADVNGDGKLDLIALSNSTASEVTVFLGNGDGTFASSAITSAISAPANASGANLVVADFNNDGKPDIATSNGQILLGHGDGTFTLASQSLPEPNQNGITAADFNKDGKVDLAFNSNGLFIDVYYGNGDGSFTYKGAYPAIPSGGSLESTDLDGDGYPDLFVGTAQGGGFTSDAVTQGLSQAILNRGDGTFGTTRAYFPGSGVYDSADFTGDGHPDLITVGWANSTGEGPSSFITPSGFIFGPGSTVLRVLKGAGDGTFAITGTSTPITGANSVLDVPAIAAGDLNGDGKSDIVVACTCTLSSPNIAVALGNGDGTFQTQQNYPISGGFSAGVNTLLLKDLNGDGKPDILYLAGTGLYARLNNGDGTFAAAQLIDSEPDMNQMAAQDVNGDGHIDVVVSASDIINDSGTPGAAYLYLGKGDGTFQAPVTLNPGSHYPSDVAIADMNKDGKPDLVFAGVPSLGGQETATVLLGNGNGTFQSGVTSTVTGNTDFPAGIVVVDFNGDGKPDVVLAGTSSPYFLSGNGDGTLTALGLLQIGIDSTNLKTADLTGLGLGDLIFNSGPTGGGGIEVFVASASSGTASPNFQLGLSPASGTVTAGANATTTVSISPQNGFASAVSFACSGLPAGASCSFSPTSVTPNGAAVTATLTITTTERTAQAPPNAHPGFGSPWVPGTVVLAVALIPWLRIRRSGFAAGPYGLIWVLLVSAPLLHGCGGGGSSTSSAPSSSSSSSSSGSSSSSSGSTSSSASSSGSGSSTSSSGGSTAGTPAGTYSVTVTASGGSVTQGLQYQLTVK